MGNIKSKEELTGFLKKIDKQQHDGPFTLRDSGIKDEFHKKLDSNAVRYDNEPVTACPNCNSLYLLDVDDKLECFNCGHEIAEKDVVVYKSIQGYLENEGSKDTNDT